MFPSKISTLAISTLTPVVNSYSILFDGTNDYVEVTDSDVNISSPITISAWIKVVTAGTYDGIVNNALRWNYGGYRVAKNADGGISYNYNEGNQGYVAQTGAGRIVASSWYHIVITRTGASVKIYINGIEEQISTGSPTAGTGNQYNDLQIGIEKNDSTYRYPFPGNIDGVAIWDVVLDTPAIESIYNQGEPIDLTNNAGHYTGSGDLVGYWRFEQGTGTSATDSSTNANAGTLTNSPAWSIDVPM
tara:strand:+ start:406 stop:1143 length:738 start_codon:yes stop_codon:yes gene_type:complete